MRIAPGAPAPPGCPVHRPIVVEFSTVSPASLTVPSPPAPPPAPPRIYVSELEVLFQPEAPPPPAPYPRPPFAKVPSPDPYPLPPAPPAPPATPPPPPPPPATATLCPSPPMPPGAPHPPPPPPPPPIGFSDETAPPDASAPLISGSETTFPTVPFVADVLLVLVEPQYLPPVPPLPP